MKDTFKNTHTDITDIRTQQAYTHQPEHTSEVMKCSEKAILKK